MEALKRPEPPAGGMSARHLISVDDLADAEIAFMLDLARHYAGWLEAGERPPQRLAGKTQVNLFFEDSTRTNLSFELAGKKLGADVINVPVAASSVNKGETLVDTAETLAAMGAHALVLRCREAGLHQQLAKTVRAAVINGGDGVREHPTQALLDAATIRSAFGTLEGLTIAICGDVRHSRVAASGADLFRRLGARVRFVGPENLMPPPHLFPDVPRIHVLKEGLGDVDIAMALRMQFERMEGEDAKERRAAAKSYFRAFGLSHRTLEWARPGAKVMHPGPMNRGIEIDDALADDPQRSLILTQVFYGVATRMAVLDALTTGGR